MWIDYDPTHVPEDNPGYHEQVQCLMEIQDGVCALCGADLIRRGGVLDHDHETGLTRGLLCCSCNTTLGMPKALGQKQKRYLARPPARKLGWFYVSSWGDVPMRTGGYQVDMDRARAAVNALSFASRDDDPTIDPL